MCASSQEGGVPESGFGLRLGTFYKKKKNSKFLLVFFFLVLLQSNEFHCEVSHMCAIVLCSRSSL